MHWNICKLYFFTSCSFSKSTILTTVLTNIVVDKSTDHTKPLVFFTTIPTSNKTILSVRDHCVDASSVVCTLSVRQIGQSDCDNTALHPRAPVPHYRVKWKILGSFMLRIADFRVLYENTFYHSRWLNIWHWFCGFSLKSRILIFYYLASHTDRSYPIIHRWTFCTSLRAKYNNLLLFGKRSFSFGLRRNIFIRVLFFKFILMQEAIFMQNTLNLKNEKYSGYR